MKPLTKPYKGISIVIFGVLFHFNWAKSWLWADTSDKGIRHTYIFSIFTAKKSETASALSIILGPIKIMIGVL